MDFFSEINVLNIQTKNHKRYQGYLTNAKLTEIEIKQIEISGVEKLFSSCTNNIKNLFE